ncbi:MAG: SUMF1/EgtB/PvdO family nonheme iron enzyme [Thermoguttaceae bacterium]
MKRSWTASGQPTLLALVALFALGLFAPAAWAVNNGDVPINTPASARRVIDDLTAEFGDRYPDGKEYLARLDAIEAKLKENADDSDAKSDLDALIREATLANPLLDFDRLLVIRRKGEANRSLNSHTSATIKRSGWDNDIAVLSNLRGDVKAKTLYRHRDQSVMKHMDLDFSGNRVMFSGMGRNGNWAVLEVDAEGNNLQELTPDDQEDVQWFDSCYLPDSNTFITCSTAGMQGLPCENGGKPMVNLYKVDVDAKQIRQLTFEQDSDWHPRVMHNGRVMYLRWEYTDIPHYYSRYLFHMNPDGTGQMEYWGSGSHFPTAYVWARPIPNHATMTVGIVSGHHAKSETGRLLLLNPALGRKYPLRYKPEEKIWGPEGETINLHPEVFPAEVTGCVQEIPGWGRDVVGNVYDGQGGGQQYTFGTPWPLSDKYFLVSMKGCPGTNKWALCLVDIFDNMTVVYQDPDYDLFEPIPFVPRRTPPMLVDRTIPGMKEATVFCTDIYSGRGLKGVPRGTVKSLRVISYHYGYVRSGGHESIGQESSWDIKRILGTVPVETDGSFCFTAPANTPIAIQPLDENGQAVALMRSWMVGMPGERLACNGCHEDQNAVTPNRRTIAGTRPPRAIEPWYGPARPFSYQTDVQPTLDRYCVGCHNDEDNKAGLSFVANNPGNWRKDTSYAALNPYVRRPGPESDMDMLNPMEYHSSTSELIQRLRKGHHGVSLDSEAWDRLYTWIDLNAPYRGMWDNANYEKRRLELATLYAGLLDNPEEEHRLQLASIQGQTIKPILPEKQEKPGPDGLKASGFPFDASKAKQLQGKDAAMELRLADGLTMQFVRIPAGQFVMGSQSGMPDEQPRAVVHVDKPFWMGVTETTNSQFGAFDPEHDTRYIDEHGKDHSLPGNIANHADQPVARISWQEAMNFCRWLSDKSGKKVTLPTEAQWEWAARAGSEKQFFYGDNDADFSKWANLADAGRRLSYYKFDGGSKIHVRRPYPENSTFPLRDDRFTDKWFIVDYVAQYDANPFGLYDMVGNVSEWTRSDYATYPYNDANGRNDGDIGRTKVARGGSWDDRPKVVGSTRRFEYESFQKVYDVGFRVIVE